MPFKIMKLCISVPNYHILLNSCFCSKNMMHCFTGHPHFGKCIACKLILASFLLENDR